MAIEHTDCEECEGGTNSSTCSYCDGNGQLYESRTCWCCNGDGEIQLECAGCDGDGEIEHEVIYLNLSYKQIQDMKDRGELVQGMTVAAHFSLSETPNWNIHKDHYVPNFPSSPNPGDPVVICLLVDQLGANYDGGLNYDGNLFLDAAMHWAKYGEDKKDLEFVTG